MAESNWVQPGPQEPDARGGERGAWDCSFGDAANHSLSPPLPICCFWGEPCPEHGVFGSLPSSAQLSQLAAEVGPS